MVNFSDPSAEVIGGMKSFYAIYASCGFFLGLPGSLLTFIVTLRNRNLRVSTRMFQGLLALFDAAVLLTGLLRYCVLAILYYDLRDLNAMSCRLHTFITYLVIDMSTWLLCALTVERFVLVTWPTVGHGSNRQKLLRFSFVMNSFLLCVAIAKNTPLLFRLYQALAQPPCGNALDPVVSMVLQSWFDFVLGFTLPNILILVSCTGILKVLRKNRVSNRPLAASPPQADGTGTTPGVQAQQPDSVQQAALFATKMMLGMGLVYLLTTLPSYIYTVITIFPDSLVGQYEAQVSVNLVYEGLMILLFTGSISRFYVCVVSSRQFRSELQSLWSSSRLAEVISGRSGS